MSPVQSQREPNLDASLCSNQGDINCKSDANSMCACFNLRYGLVCIWESGRVGEGGKDRDTE